MWNYSAVDNPGQINRIDRVRLFCSECIVCFCILFFIVCVGLLLYLFFHLYNTLSADAKIVVESWLKRVCVCVVIGFTIFKFIVSNLNLQPCYRHHWTQLFLSLDGLKWIVMNNNEDESFLTIKINASRIEWISYSKIGSHCIKNRRFLAWTAVSSFWKRNVFSIGETHWNFTIHEVSTKIIKILHYKLTTFSIILHLDICSRYGLWAAVRQSHLKCPFNIMRNVTI